MINIIVNNLLRFFSIVGILFLLADFSVAQDDHGFRFIRIQYNDYGDGYGRFGRRGEPRWAHDYPTAEDNLYEALKRTTKVDIAGQYKILSLADKEIFKHPFLYICEPGYWQINEQEAENLREYLERGGFVMFDDFRGQQEWMNLYFNLKMVFPDKEPEEIRPDNPIWSIYYSIDPVAAPSWVSGRYSMFDDTYYALYDDNGRMMTIICHNQDIGDGWEYPDGRLDVAGTLPFQMGINFIIYAMTH